MGYIRDFMQRVNWDARLLVIKGPKGVGKSTLLQQFIKTRFDEDDRLKAWAPDETRLQQPRLRTHHFRAVDLD